MAKVTLVAAWLAESYKNSRGEPRLPLGILYLAGQLLRQGHEVEIKDCQLEPDRGSAVDLVIHTLRDSTDIIGISCMSDLLPAVLLAITRHKEKSPNSTIILGGPGPTSVASDILLYFPAVDYIVIGEGEVTLTELINRLENGSDTNNISGLCYRNEKVIHCGVQRTRIKDLDRLHPLPYSIMRMELYHAPVPISTSRGCTYGCSFCDVGALWHRSVTQRSVDNVISELSELCGRGRYKFSIVDDTFILNHRRVQEFCYKIIQNQLPVFWHCNGRINLVDESLLEIMAEAGCVSMFFGVESGSDAVLKRIHKGFNTAQVLRSIKLAAKHIPLVTVSFIWGFPFETLSDFQQTRELYLRLGEIENVKLQLYELTPFANAPIYREFYSHLYLDMKHSIDLNGERFVDSNELALIRRYPRIFANFYRFHTPDKDEKLKIISADGRLFEG